MSKWLPGAGTCNNTVATAPASLSSSNLLFFGMGLVIRAALDLVVRAADAACLAISLYFRRLLSIHFLCATEDWSKAGF